MLMLTRRAGEKIIIGGTICVTVVAIQGRQVRLGITAPASVLVDRSEVHERRGTGGLSLAVPPKLERMANP